MRKLILVVDDDEDCREIVCEFLTNRGYAVVQATNGKEAIDFLLAEGQEQPFLIVLDIEMPVMSGWEFLAIARSYQLLATIPVLIASGSQKESESLRHGAVVGYLAKPFNIATLLAKIEAFAGNHDEAEA